MANTVQVAEGANAVCKQYLVYLSPVGSTFVFRRPNHHATHFPPVNLGRLLQRFERVQLDDGGACLLFLLVLGQKLNRHNVERFDGKQGDQLRLLITF